MADKKYRRVWEEVNGPIPLDDKGRTYEIHHINGDNTDNRLENLLCVSIHDHYAIHLQQGDFLAAAAVVRRIGFDLAAMQLLSSAAGKEARDKGAGFHGLTEEQKLENCRLGGLASKGLRWYNNGVESTRSLSCPGKEWIPGKIPCGSGMRAGTKLGVFWNDGTKNIRADECPGDGWVRGKYLTEEQRRRRAEIAKRPKRKRDMQ